MMDLIDGILNRITMYRLTLYYLISLIVVAAFLGAFHLLPYSPVFILLSSLFLVFFGSFANDLLAYVFKAPVNVESAYITALILALIVAPAKSLNDYFFLAIISTAAMASKFVFAVNRKHVFNPAALAVALAAVALNRPAIWWVGDAWLLPVVIGGGLLLIRKLKREDMALSFFFSVVSFVFLFSLLQGISVIKSLNETFLHSSFFFFMSVMLTEPLTTPPTYLMQVLYGAITGFLFVPQVHLGPVYSTPEIALLGGNIFSYLVSPKEKLLLTLKDKVRLSPDIYDFVFPLKRRLAFKPGQYMEFTLPHEGIDSRGNRRYFTLASSPTEDTLRIGVRFYGRSSSFKKKMLALKEGDTVTAGQLAGDFILEKSRNKKYVFIAGGIGITPFRSILKNLIDKGERRDIVVLYSNKNSADIVYRDVLDEAARKLGIKVVLTLTDTGTVPASWPGKTGRISADMIREEIPDYEGRAYYLSGPHALVDSFEKVLTCMGIPAKQIRVDFFPGFV